MPDGARRGRDGRDAREARDGSRRDGRGAGRAAGAVRAAFTEHVPYKLAALFFACVLWLVVSGEEQTSAWVTVRVAPILDGAVRLRAPAPRLRARVTGPARELLALSATPPVLRRPIGSDAPDTLRLEVQPEDIELPATASRVRVREVRPRRLLLRLTGTTSGAATMARRAEGQP